MCKSNEMTFPDFFADCRAPSGAFKYFNKNEWLESTSGKTVKITNPTTNTTAFEVQGKI